VAGIYIHIPFCKQRCTYCDFHFSTSFSNYYSEMISCLILEIKNRAFELRGQHVETIYFGGGTPSLISSSDLNNLLGEISNNYDVIDLPEITLEANPDDMTISNLRSWKKAGVNRLSVGIQSFREKDLKWMNRAHNSEESKACLRLAQEAGFQNFSVDLIYGLPDLSMAEWKEQIHNVIGYGVQHISAYCLTVEERTILAKKVKEGEIIPADEDTQALHFNTLLEVLEKSGYEQYEVSNFCLPDFEAKHNTSYWKGVPYVGIGPSAHSFDGQSRRSNVANNALYMKGLNEGNSYYEIEILSDKEKFNETLMTGLRTKWGVSLYSLTKLHVLTKEFKDKLYTFLDKGWMREENDILYLDGDGWLMADFIASELFVV
jgi:oxygen-independent coproporphyrinogen III oxidase